MAGSSTQFAYGIPRRPPLPLFAGSDIFAGAAVAFAEPFSASTSTGLFVKMVTASTEKPIGIALADAAVNEAVAIVDRGDWPRINCGGSIQPGQYVGVSGTSEAAHPVSGIKNKYPVFGKVSGASGTATWALGVALEAANPNEKFTFYCDPLQLSSTTAAVGVLG